MNHDELRQIEERVEKATKGPWEHCFYDGTIITGNGNVFKILEALLPDFMFLAHARDDIPTLISHVRELEAKIESMENAAYDEAVLESLEEKS